jgi:dTDP-L-rhamnose 4-epimerase
VLGVEHPAAANQIFNVGAGVPVSVLTVAETLRRLFDADVPITVTGNFRIGDIRHNFADMTKIGALLGFKPAYDFERGLALFVEWAKGMGARSSGYEASLEEMRQKGLLK